MTEKKLTKQNMLTKYLFGKKKSGKQIIDKTKLSENKCLTEKIDRNTFEEENIQILLFESSNFPHD